MKIKILVMIVLISGGCGSSAKVMERNLEQRDPIQIAIEDFSQNCSLYKKDSVFSVRLLQPRNNDEKIIVRVGRNYKKMLLKSSSTVGSRGQLASRYIEKNGKLFFWWDDNYALTEDALAVFRKYNLLQDDEDGFLKMSDFITTKSISEAHYYFCKERFTGFKRVVSNKGVGYYTPPKLECDKKKQ